MKNVLKDYGSLIGPALAFILGVMAIYIKFYTDRQLENWKSRKKLKKLFKLIKESKPPLKYYPNKSSNFIHADQARNLTNHSIFYKKIKVINYYINNIEEDILTNGSLIEIQQFTDLQFVISYMNRDIETFRNGSKQKDENLNFKDLDKSDFLKIMNDYDRLVTIIENPGKEFKYIES